MLLGQILEVQLDCQKVLTFVNCHNRGGVRILSRMEYMKREDECCCCFIKEDLFNMLEPYNFEEEVEIYSIMIAECFQIELNPHIEECNKKLYLLCKNCVLRLRDAILLRSQVQIAYDRLQAEYRKRDNSVEYSDKMKTIENMKSSDISNLTKYYCKVEKDEYAPIECSDIVQTKGNLLNYDISKNALSDDLKLKPLKVELINKTIKSTKERLKKLKNTNGRYDKKDTRIHSTRNFTCSMCGKTLSCKHSLDNHILIHSGEKSQKCEICGKVFVTRDTLVKHSRLHVNPKKWTCKYCNKSFQYSFTLMQHEKLHSDVKELTCDICKRPFRYKSNLRQHIMLHMKNIKCEMCEKSFVSKTDFLAHKSYCRSTRVACNVCGKLFNKKALVQHKMVHIEVRKFACDNCGAAFKTKGSVYMHILKHCKRAINKINSKI